MSRLGRIFDRRVCFTFLRDDECYRISRQLVVEQPDSDRPAQCKSGECNRRPEHETAGARQHAAGKSSFVSTQHIITAAKTQPLNSVSSGIRPHQADSHHEVFTLFLVPEILSAIAIFTNYLCCKELQLDGINRAPRLTPMSVLPVAACNRMLP